MSRRSERREGKVKQRTVFTEDYVQLSESFF